jgi:signal peptidase I
MYWNFQTLLAAGSQFLRLGERSGGNNQKIDSLKISMITENTRLIREMQEELFRKQGQGWFRIVSGSMRPLIDVGDRVLCKPVSAAQIKPRDIILFNSAEALVTHRVIKIARQNGRGRMSQKGDASAFAGTITFESVMGRVTAVEKNGKVLTLDKGRIGVLNTFLGYKNCCFNRFNGKVSLVKRWFRNKPEYRCLRAVYRIFRAPFDILNQTKIVGRITRSTRREEE